MIYINDNLYGLKFLDYHTDNEDGINPSIINALVTIPNQRYNVLEESVSSVMYRFIANDGLDMYIKGEYIISLYKVNG